jgi:hypothetical protein
MPRHSCPSGAWGGSARREDIAVTAAEPLDLVAAIVTFGSGSILLGYTDRAMSQGWTTGSLLNRPIVSNALGFS